MSFWRRISKSAIFSLPLVPFSGAFAGNEEVPVQRTDVGGLNLNSLVLEPVGETDLPPIVFLHGASASLYDPLLSFGEKLAGRARLLFIDRPGHGDSDAGGAANLLPDGQADAVAVLMEKRGIAQAVIVGHSFGGAIAAALAVRHPDKVAGLVFLSPAVYPWDSGIAWYYSVARAPVIGHIFSALVIPPLGLLGVDRATKAVFAPNTRPAEYVSKARALQAINPRRFRHNAKEVAALSDWARDASRNYPQIKSPAVIITGDADKIVCPDIHARHLARDIRKSTLVVIQNLGHKSDLVANDLAIAAIEKVSGLRADLRGAKDAVEQRIAHDGKD